MKDSLSGLSDVASGWERLQGFVKTGEIQRILATLGENEFRAAILALTTLHPVVIPDGRLNPPSGTFDLRIPPIAMYGPSGVSSPPPITQRLEKRTYGHVA
jgi:hypothetical protein